MACLVCASVNSETAGPLCCSNPFVPRNATATFKLLIKLVVWNPSIDILDGFSCPPVMIVVLSLFNNTFAALKEEVTIVQPDRFAKSWARCTIVLPESR